MFSTVNLSTTFKKNPADLFVKGEMCFKSNINVWASYKTSVFHENEDNTVKRIITSNIFTSLILHQIFIFSSKVVQLFLNRTTGWSLHPVTSDSCISRLIWNRWHHHPASHTSTNQTTSSTCWVKHDITPWSITPH